MDWIKDNLGSLLESILNATIFKLFYYIEYGLCWIIDVLTDLFSVFAGLERVTYNNSHDFLVNILFSNKAVSNIYWGMALIGVALTIAFTIWAVVKKMFDASGKMQQSIGQIITATVRSIILILSMNLVMTVVINVTNTLMQQVDYIFNNAYYLDQPEERTFSDEEYAAMGRVLSTIGNYSLVTSSNNRYNINSCFNAIRADMYFLQRQGVFDYSYYREVEGKESPSWQSILSAIAKSADLTSDVKVDIYNEGVAKSILAAMDYLKNNKTVVPVDYVKRTYQTQDKTHLDRLVFLMGTMRAAKNEAFNKEPGIDDALRGQYYFAEGKDIYNFSQVNGDFDIGFKTDYIVVWVAAIAVIFDLVVIILNCVARMFNLLFLYIIAPPVIAASPLDNGGKFKQWSTAFLVQALSVFGTVIAMRLLLIYLPIVMSPSLKLFDPSEHAILNMFAKLIMVWGGFEAAKKSTGLLTGILADNAGWQSLTAGDMSASAGKALGKVTAVGKAAAGTALGVGKAVAGFALSPVTNTLARPFKAVGQWWSNLGKAGDDPSRPASGWGAREDPKSSGGGSGGGGGSTPPRQSPPPPAPSEPERTPPNNTNTNPPLDSNNPNPQPPANNRQNPGGNNNNNNNDLNQPNNRNNNGPAPGNGPGNNPQPPRVNSAPPLPNRYNRE
ncbi:MAG: hypothetical protein IJM83_00220 [Firmicutes bacterium]|nr:hypothetical protein [Bacillota bacterium]